MLRASSALLLSALLACSGCRSGAAPRPETASPEPEAVAAAPVVRSEDRPVVLFLGDSLSAGFGLAAEEAFPALVEERLAALGRPVRVVNAGLSGDTTSGGLRRLEWVVAANRPDVVVLELGGNDGLRGLGLEETEANLRALIEGSRAAGARVLLAGMRIPTNYGPDYTSGFAAIYPRLAEETGAALIPFLLDGVAAQPSLNLPDGIHPNAEGHRIIAGTVARHLLPLIETTAD